MSDNVIFVKVAEMGSDGSGGRPQEKVYDEAKTVGYILQDLGIDAAGRKIKLNAQEASLETLVTQDNATIAVMPKKMKSGL